MRGQGPADHIAETAWDGKSVHDTLLLLLLPSLDHCFLKHFVLCFSPQLPRHHPLPAAWCITVQEKPQRCGSPRIRGLSIHLELPVLPSS